MLQAWALESRQIANWFLEEHEAVWVNWVTPEVFNQVRKALEAEPIQ